METDTTAIEACASTMSSVRLTSLRQPLKIYRSYSLSFGRVDVFERVALGFNETRTRGQLELLSCSNLIATSKPVSSRQSSPKGVPPRKFENEGKGTFAL